MIEKRQAIPRMIVPAVLLLAVVAGCSALQLQGVWEDTTYQGGRPKNCLVVCAMPVPTVKRTFESAFVNRLREHGITAVESFRSVPADLHDQRAAVVALIKTQGYDAVLVTRALAGRSEVRSIPGMTIQRGVSYPYASAGAWGSYAGAAVSVGGPSQPTTQGYAYEQKYLSIETLLFDTRTEACLWSSVSELRLGDRPEEQIGPYVAMISSRLARSRLFTGRP